MDHLLAASRAGDAAAIDAIVAANSEALVDAEDERGERPLHLACRSGSTSAVAALLAAGADPNAMSVYGNTALKLASAEGCEPVVKLLLAAGAEPNRTGPSGDTPCLSAIIAGNAEMVPTTARPDSYSLA